MIRLPDTRYISANVDGDRFQICPYSAVIDTPAVVRIMKISPSVKVDKLEKKRLPPSLLHKREETRFPVHPVDAYFLHKTSPAMKRQYFVIIDVFLSRIMIWI
jgi:hypothetical protein